MEGGEFVQAPPARSPHPGVARIRVPHGLLETAGNGGLDVEARLGHHPLQLAVFGAQLLDFVAGGLPDGVSGQLLLPL
jgi:hypothetical protein